MTKKDLGLMVLVVAILVKLNFFPDTDPLPYGVDPDRAMWNVNSDIVAPHSLIQRWLALLYYLYYLRLAALYKTVWNDYTYEFSRWALNILLGGGLIRYLWKNRKG